MKYNFFKLKAKLRDLKVGTFIKYDNEVFIAVGMDPDTKKVLCVSKSGKEIYLELDTKVELIPYQVKKTENGLEYLARGGSEHE